MHILRKNNFHTNEQTRRLPMLYNTIQLSKLFITLLDKVQTHNEIPHESDDKLHRTITQQNLNLNDMHNYFYAKIMH